MFGVCRTFDWRIRAKVEERPSWFHKETTNKMPVIITLKNDGTLTGGWARACLYPFLLEMKKKQERDKGVGRMNGWMHPDVKGIGQKSSC